MATRKFAWIAEGDVFGVFTIVEEQNPAANARITAGLLSNPIVIEVIDNDSVSEGWTWDGETFNPPVG